MEEKELQNATKKTTLESLMELVHKYGKSTALYTVLLFLVYTTILKDTLYPPHKQMEETITTYNDQKEREHELGIQKRKEADLLIPSYLESLRLKVNADKILVFEFHNGGVNSKNLPFYHFSSTYEVINDAIPNLEYTSEQYHQQNTGDYTTLLTEMKNKSYVFYNDLDSVKVKNKAIKRMLINGLHQSYISALYGEHNNLIGFISLTCLKPNQMKLDDLNRYTPIATQQIGTLLLGIKEIKE